MPIGSPLDSSPDFQGGPALPIAAAPTSPPYDVPQPRQRVRGTIELAAPGDEIGDITTSADPRASAFQSVRPLDWANASKQLKLEIVHRIPAPRKVPLSARRTLDRSTVVPTTSEDHSPRNIQKAPNTTTPDATS